METDPSSSVRQPLLEAEDVEKRFDGLRAVAGMDIEIEQGELVGLIGPNGAGKTTFFNVLAGYLDPDEGRVVFDGEDITGLPSYRIARRGLVRTFQLTRTLDRMTLLENMMLAPDGQRGERMWAPYLPFVGRPVIDEQEDRIRKEARDLLDFFDLDHLEQEYAGALSGGQRKLLELARALMLKPKMLLLDEPMAGVNPTLANKLIDRLHTIREERGLTILLIEHDMETVMNNCERVVVMAEGRQLAVGTPEEIQDHQDVMDAYLGGG